MLPIIYVVLLSIQICFGSPPQITAVSYSKRNLNINDDLVEAHVFKVQFDSLLFVTKRNVSIRGLGGYTKDFSTFSKTVVQFKGILQPIQTLSNIDFFLNSYVDYWNNDGIFDFSCNKVDHLSNQQVDPGPSSTPPPQFVFGDMENSLASYLATFYNIPQLYPQNPYKKQNLTFVVLGQILNSQNSYSQISQIENQILSGNCQITVSNIYSETLELSQQVFNSRNFTAARIPDCDHAALNQSFLAYESAVSDLLKMKNYDSLIAADNAIKVLMATDSWFGCENFISNVAVSSATLQSDFYGIYCDKSSSDPDYSFDPCCSSRPLVQSYCNSTLKKSTFSALGSYNQFALTQCKSDYVMVAIGAIYEYLDHINNYKEKCENILFNQLGVWNPEDLKTYDLYSIMFQPFESCMSAIYGSNVSLPVCSKSSDCYTKCIIPDGSSTGFCALPYGTESLAFATCLIERADPKVLLSLANLLGVTNSMDPTSLSNAINDYVGESSCVGPSGYKYNDGWYQSGAYAIPSFSFANSSITQDYGMTNTYVYSDSYYDFVGTAYTECEVFTTLNGLMTLRDQSCFFLPGSAKACSGKKTCNWGFSGNCSLNRFGSDSFCGECYGNKCIDRTNPSLCTYSKGTLTDTYSFSNDECSALNGTLWSDPAFPSSNGYCLASPIGLEGASECLQICENGPNPVIANCFSTNYNTLDQCLAATNGSGYLMSLYSEDTAMVTYVCIFIGVTNPQCNSKTGFNFGQPSLAIDGASGTSSRMLCEQSYCYSTEYHDPNSCIQARIVSSSGNKYTSVYDWNLNYGSGYCKIIIPTANITYFKNECSSSGFTPYIGIYQKPGNFESNADCYKRCDSNPNLSDTDCKNTYRCNGKCKNCKSAFDGALGFTNYTICIKKATNSSSCVSDRIQGYNATWDRNSTSCIYSGLLSINYCESLPGSFDLSCASFNSINCSTNLYQNYLRCSSISSDCQTRQQCINEGGYCTDIFDFPNDSGQCLLPFPSSNNINGLSAICTSSLRTTKMGCVDSNMTKADCQNNMGTWIYRATSQSECVAKSGCCEPQFNCGIYLSSKNFSECTKSKGYLTPAYNYIPGKWYRGTSSSLQWTKRMIVNENSWINSININKLKFWFLESIESTISKALSSYFSCKKIVFFDSLTKISCFCGSNFLPSCLSVIQNTALSILSEEVVCNLNRTISGMGVSINLPANPDGACQKKSVLEVLYYPASLTDVSINFTVSSNDPGNYFGGGYNDVHKRDSTLSNAMNFSVVDSSQFAGCYEKVVNSYGATVGEIRGDCVSYSVDSPISLELCLELKPTLFWNSNNYTIPGYATVSFDSNNNARYLAGDVAIQKANFFCFSPKTSNSIFCPASLVPGFNEIFSRTSIGSCIVLKTLHDQITSKAVLALGSGKTLSVSTFGSPLNSGKSITVYVTVLDSDRSTAVDSYIPITAKVSRAEMGARIVGNSVSYPKNGIAVFDDLSVNLAGTVPYVFQFSGFGLISGTSSGFQVRPWGTNGLGLTFVVQPKVAVVGVPLLKTPVLQVIDINGNPFLQSTQPPQIITVTFIDLGTGYEYAIDGLRPSSPINGILTLSGISFPITGSNFVLKATGSNLTPVFSDPFNVVQSYQQAVQLEILSLPQINFYSAFSVEVWALDFNNVLDRSASGKVILSIANTTRHGALLLGELEQPLIGGVAKFNGLEIDKPGVSFTLMASSNYYIEGFSNSFTVNGPAAFVFNSIYDDIYTNTQFSLSIQCIDVLRGVYAYLSESVTISFKKSPANAILSGTFTVQVINGQASFDDLSVSAAGAYQFKVVSDSGYVGLSEVLTVNDQGITGSPVGTTKASREARTASMQELNNAKDSNNVDTTFLGLVIGAASVGIAILLQFIFKLKSVSKKHKRGTKETNQKYQSVKLKGLNKQKAVKSQ